MLWARGHFELEHSRTGAKAYSSVATWQIKKSLKPWDLANQSFSSSPDKDYFSSEIANHLPLALAFKLMIKVYGGETTSSMEYFLRFEVVLHSEGAL